MGEKTDSVIPIDSDSGALPMRACSSPPADDKATWRDARDQLVRLAYRFLWNHDQAEDVAQDALIRAWAKADELRDRDQWWSWVCRIAVQRCRERGRIRQRRSKHEEKLRHELREGRKPDEPAGRERHEALPKLLDELPRRQREVLVLRHLQGMAVAEIAGVLGLSPSTVRVHLMVGRESLRRLILLRHPEWLEG